MTALDQEAGWQGHHVPLPGRALSLRQSHQTALCLPVLVPPALLAEHLASVQQLHCPVVTARKHESTGSSEWYMSILQPTA